MFERDAVCRKVLTGVEKVEMFVSCCDNGEDVLPIVRCDLARWSGCPMVMKECKKLVER